MGAQLDNVLVKAAFATGCFWSVEVAFRQAEGVVMTSMAYCGGDLLNPNYEKVHTGRSGHAELVQVTFDPGRVSYEDLLAFFWLCHDLRQLNRQYPDVSSQYGSAVFCQDDDQGSAPEAARQALVASGEASGTVVTEILMLSNYFGAEDYHQQYMEKRGMAVPVSLTASRI